MAAQDGPADFQVLSGRKRGALLAERAPVNRLFAFAFYILLSNFYSDAAGVRSNPWKYN